MKHLSIRNFGILKEAEIDLQKTNVIIGPQSMGKSTVLKIASYCSWVEKRIQTTQDPTIFSAKGAFISFLVDFHRLHGYNVSHAFIGYESDYMKFSYRSENDLFEFEWKKKRWSYRRPKLSYIPAERNLVAVIPNWFEVTSLSGNIRSFMAEWETARTSLRETDILNLGVKFRYDSDSRKDRVLSSDGTPLDLVVTSSGLQSLIPLMVHLNYLYYKHRVSERERYKTELWDNVNIADAVYTNRFELNSREMRLSHPPYTRDKRISYNAIAAGKLYKFTDEKVRDEFVRTYERYLLTDNIQVFLEEPENNLFPPTQVRLIDWLVDRNMSLSRNTLFIATHSPYVMSRLLKRTDIDLSVMVVHETDEGVKVSTLSEEDIQAIYDYGVDMFFNLDDIVE